MAKSIAELEAEMKRLENKLRRERQSEKITKRTKELEKKILRLKYDKQIKLAQKMSKGTKTGLLAAAKLVGQGFAAIQKYNAKLEAQQKKATRKARSKKRK